MGSNAQKPAVRWNVKVSKETDSSLRSFLRASGGKRVGLSAFIEDAVRWRLFSREIRAIKARNAQMDPGELQNLIDETVREVRAGRRSKVR